MYNYLFEVDGSRELKGSVMPSGNKNESLPVLAASLLTEDTVVIKNIPNILDTDIMQDIMKDLGSDIDCKSSYEITINTKTITNWKPNPQKSSKIRSSLLFIPALLHRNGKTIIPSSGGDKIGRRRIDTHLIGLKELGVEFDDEEGILYNGKLKPANIILDEASVMATENLIMMSVLIKGTTTIYNAACEPHVQGLCIMLNKMGAKISGIGSNFLVIEGVEKLHGCQHTVAPDHIEIGSFIGLAAATSSNICIKDANISAMDIIIPHFTKLGIPIEKHGADLLVNGKQPKIVKQDFQNKIPSISDQPWPSFPADLTSIAVVSALFSSGTVMIHEKMFEGRLFFTDSLIQMGAQLVLCDPHRVVISGPPAQLKAINLSSPDIRAGMSLLIAALAAKGKSTIYNVRQIDRGYEYIDQRLNSLGAKIVRKRYDALHN